MRMLRLFEIASLTALVLAGSVPSARADIIFNVSVNTSGLSSYTAPLGIDFQMVSGGVASTNSATISNINFGGGSPTGSPSSLAGNVSGSLSSTVSLEVDNPSNFFSDFNQGFTPGSTLSFQVDLTTNVGSTPDTFAFYILQGYSSNYGFRIPTTDSLASSLISINITSNNPTIQTFGGLNGVPPPPTITSVPEPGTLILFSVGLGLLIAGHYCHRRRGVVAA